MKVIYLLGAVALLIAGVMIFWHPVSTQTQIQNALTRVDTQIAPITGDQLSLYIPVKPISNLTQQLSTNPIIPMEFKQFLGTQVVGNDSHGNLLIKNNTQIINSSTLNKNATSYLLTHPELFNKMQNITGSGVSYGSTSAGTATLAGTTTDSVTAGQVYKLSGKLSLFDKTKCHIVMQNGQTTTQCPTIIGPYQIRIQIECVDTDPFRCAYLQDKLPTNRQETHIDGSFLYTGFTTIQDKYYVGNYNAHFFVESEQQVNGQTVQDEYDHSFTVLHW